MMTSLDYALHYAGLGLCVHQVHGVLPRGACTCGSTDLQHKPGKHPVLLSWNTRSTIDRKQISTWFESGSWNIGIATGHQSGIFCLDIDAGHDGYRSLQLVSEALGALPETWTVTTGGGGKHLYFRHPGAGWKIVTKANILKDRSLPGIDLRGDGGQIVAPPSLHHSGKAYEWLLGPWDVPLADLPLRWVTLLQRVNVWQSPETPPEPLRLMSWRPAGKGNSGKWAATAFEQEIDRVKQAPGGVGNQVLFEASCKLFEIVKAGYLPKDEVQSALLQAATMNGRRTIHESTQSIESAWQRVAPRHPEGH